jgi:hypothetical protein
MITQVIELLQSMDFKGGTDRIEFAKGSYRYPRNIKETFNTAKRWLSRK